MRRGDGVRTARRRRRSSSTRRRGLLSFLRTLSGQQAVARSHLSLSPSPLPPFLTTKQQHSARARLIESRESTLHLQPLQQKSRACARQASPSGPCRSREQSVHRALQMGRHHHPNAADGGGASASLPLPLVGAPALCSPSPAALSLVLSAEIGSVMTAMRQNTKWRAPTGRYNVS